jgi:hypothetical protein
MLATPNMPKMKRQFKPSMNELYGRLIDLLYEELVWIEKHILDSLFYELRDSGELETIDQDSLIKRYYDIEEYLGS